jgi:hypothetical protein
MKSAVAIRAYIYIKLSGEKTATDKESERIKGVDSSADDEDDDEEEVVASE